MKAIPVKAVSCSAVPSFDILKDEVVVNDPKSGEEILILAL